jgi:hypothetical protein
MCLASRAASAQLMRDSSTSWSTSAGSEGERYLRTLQVAGLARQTQWSVRPLTGHRVRQLAQVASHPWAAELFEPSTGTAWVRLLQPELGGIFNSGFPYGSNDGALWAGRGPTVSASAGVEGALGPIEFVLAPEVFRAENWSFELAPTGQAGPGEFADPIYPNSIDLPQRFGDGPYQRIDAGQSRVQLRLLGLVGGVTTANEVWGPAIYSPFLLGTNAAGFPHAFVGTDGAASLGPVKLSVRVIAGRLDQSAFAPASPSDRRLFTGVVAVLGVNQVPGLEVGGARVFHDAWPDTGLSVRDVLSQLGKNPFKARLTTQIGGDGSEPDNQIASFFFRWNVPRAALEIYGEVGREDNAFDMRDFLVEPDRDMSYSLGAQRVWKREDGSLVAVRGEVLNSAASHLARTRVPGPPYVHTPIAQGHTQRGQVLGAAGAYGGGAGIVAVEWLTSAGRRTITWRRMHQEPTVQPMPANVVHAVTFDWLLFRRRVDLAPEATVAYELNRIPIGDAVNFRVALTGRLHW